MEDNFRNALIIISAIIIGAIFVHGLWTIRKNKNPYKLKTNDDQISTEENAVDNNGFDQYGVSAPRVVEHSALTGEIKNPLTQEEIPEQPAPAPSFNADPLPQDVEIKDAPFEVVEEVTLPAAETTPRVEPEITLANNQAADKDPTIEHVDVEQDVSQKIEQTIALEPLYETPITQPKEAQSQEKPKTKKVRTTKAEKDALKRNQMGFNFGDVDEIETDENEPRLTSKPQQKSVKEPAIEVEPEILILSVVMPENHLMSGAALLPSLLTLGLKYGEMNIFHRHQDNAGHGKVTFSLANMVNPGTFDLDTMESFASQGVSLFMTLPNASDPFDVFNQMMSAARHLAQEFNAQILDDKRCVMTQQTEQHYITKIREFDRKHRIANK